MLNRVRNKYTFILVPTLRCKECNSPYDSGLSKRRGLCSNCRTNKDREYRSSERRKLREDVIRAYGGKCQCPGGCNVTDFEFLCLDHILDDGFRHRKQTGGAGYHTYRDVKRQGYPKSKYRILCNNCNMAREFFGKCPHEKKIANV